MERKEYLENIKVGDTIYWQYFDNNEIGSDTVTKIEEPTEYSEAMYYVSENAFLCASDLIVPNDERIKEYQEQERQRILNEAPHPETLKKAFLKIGLDKILLKGDMLDKAIAELIEKWND